MWGRPIITQLGNWTRESILGSNGATSDLQNQNQATSDETLTTTGGQRFRGRHFFQAAGAQARVPKRQCLFSLGIYQTRLAGTRLPTAHKGLRKDLPPRPFTLHRGQRDCSHETVQTSWRWSQRGGIEEGSRRKNPVPLQTVVALSSVENSGVGISRNMNGKGTSRKVRWIN